MDNKLIEKIAKILARADDERNDNPHERAIAMRQANALLVKHGLSMSDVTDMAERKDSLGKLGRTKTDMTTKFIWETGVWNEIAKLNGCSVVRTNTGNGGYKKIWVIGRQLNCTVTKQMAEYVVTSIKRESKRNGHRLCAFGVGAWTGVGEQVLEILRARKKNIVGGESVSEETALAVIDQHKQTLAETRKAQDEFFGGPVGSKNYRTGRYQGGSMEAGKHFGSKISLNNQLGG